MTRRVASVILVLVILISMTSITVFAENTNKIEKEFLFEDAFVEAFLDDGYYGGLYDYDELYYHHIDENELDSEIDWVIIYALFEPVPMEEVKIVADRLVHTSAIGDPFILHYGLYDVALNEFIAIEKVDVTKYDGFEKGLEEAKVAIYSEMQITMVS